MLRSKVKTGAMMTAVTGAVGLGVWGLFIGPECRTPIPIMWTYGVVIECWSTAAGIAGAMGIVATIRSLDVAKQRNRTEPRKQGSQTSLHE